MGIEDDPTAALEETEGQVTEGQVVSGHRIDRLLGTGGFGSVFAAMDVELGRAVAFKVLHNVEDGLLARFRDEARLLAKINDPHIIQIYRVGRLPTNEPFIAMELFGDGSLDAHFPIGRKALAGEATGIVMQVLQGLKVAHRAGVIHRDIKGANVLLDRNTGHAKLCDFGIARSQAGDNEAHTGGMVLGTPHYIAPERMQGHRDDPRSDLYSVGVVFYRLLTGRRPFESPGASPLTILHRAMTEVPVLPDDVPKGIARVCVRMLAPDPDLRYASAELAMDALKAATRTPITGAQHPLARPKSRRWAFVALGVSAVVLVAAVLVRTVLTPSAGVDLGVADAAVVDAGVVDAEFDPIEEALKAKPDAAVIDAAVVDAAVIDAAVVDAKVRKVKKRPPIHKAKPPVHKRRPPVTPKTTPPVTPKTAPPVAPKTDAVLVPSGRDWFDGE